MTVYKFPSKTYLNPDHFLVHLRSTGIQVMGFCVSKTELCVQTSPGESQDPSSLVNSYVHLSYYAITGSKPVKRQEIEGPVFGIKADGVDTVTLTITKRNGVTGNVQADNDTLDIHWHGTKAAFVSDTQITLNNGIGAVEVGRVYLPTGARVEAVHPQESVDRGVALVEAAK